MEAIINITGVIGEKRWGGQVSLIDVLSQFRKFNEPTSLTVNIESPGGVVEDGDAIYDFLKALDIPVKTITKHQCCSAAVKLFLAGDVRQVGSNCEFMIHNPWGEMAGDSEEMEGYAKELKLIENNLVKFYAEKLNLPDAALRPLMKAETFLTSEQLLSLGFATEQIQTEFEKTELKAVALSKSINLNIMSEHVTKEEMSSQFDSFFDKVKAFFSDKPKSLILQDVNGTELDFPTVEEGQEVAKDDAVNAEDGEYQMPNDTIITVRDGKVAEIKPLEVEVDEEMEALKAEMETLRERNAELEANASAFAKLKEEANEMKNLINGFKFDDTKTKPSKKENNKRSLLK